MKTKIYSASLSSLEASIQQLYDDFLQDFEEADFFFFALNPDCDVTKVNDTIFQIFHTKNFLAFHAVDSFFNVKIPGEGITLLSIQFEKKGKISSFYIEDITSQNALNQTAHYLNNNSDKFHIFIGGLCGGAISAFIEQIAQKLNYTSLNNIVGGISSGNLDAQEVLTYQFFDDKIIKNGFVIISFENVAYSTGVSFGFKPYGITYEVTKAHGNKLYDIDDGKSASYMASKMLENVGTTDVRYLWYLPFAIFHKERGCIEHLRTIAHLDDKYIELFGPIQEGDFFKLSFATYDDLLKEDTRIAREIIHMVREPEIAFNFSCIARQYVLEEHQEQELQTYQDIFQTNLFGFFTFGEIGFDKAHKRLTFHNETSLITIMREL